jgi:2,3-bisphosphoglycerate-independent phosphoglycerate mutase
MQFAIVILDGASGEPLAHWDGKTSLEAAKTPNLDALASTGEVGLVLNVPLGMEPSSNVACTSIVGYNPADYPIGRGALELAALGIDLADDEIALRLNLTNVSDDGIMVSYSTDNISNADGHALADELKAALDDDTFTLHKGTGFRSYLIVKGHPELMETKLTAAHNITDLPVADYPPQGAAAELVASYEARAKQILAQSPINQRRLREGKLPATDVFVFWPGKRPNNMEAFSELYNLHAGMLSGVDLLNGIAKLADIERFCFDGVTDGPDNDYAAQGEGALKMLESCDVIFVHVEAPDAEGHDGNIEGKRSAIEAIDREIISRLQTYAQTHPLTIIALPDHPTPVESKRHSPDPVPYAMTGPGIKHNGASRLTEAQAQATKLLIDLGCNLLARAIDATSTKQT